MRWQGRRLDRFRHRLSAGFFDLIDRQILAALFPYIKAEWSLADTQLGSLVTIVNVSIAALVVPSGILVDRWSRKKVLGLRGPCGALPPACAPLRAKMRWLGVTARVAGA